MTKQTLIKFTISLLITFITLSLIITIIALPIFLLFKGLLSSTWTYAILGGFFLVALLSFSLGWRMKKIDYPAIK